MRPSTHHSVDEHGWGPLARYVIAATLARTSDGGAVVAIVLMVNTSGGSGRLAGALGACITAPHLLGPFVARRLDTARDGRTFIAAASLAHGTALAAAVLLYPHTHPAVTAVSSTHTLGVSAAAAGILTAAYGLGNLAGSAGVMIRPSRAEADRLTTRLAAAVAATLLLISLTSSFPLAVAAYAAAGIANAYFFAATLAARNEYAPDNARGQIFVWVGALKITAGSAGTAAAGALIGTSITLPLLLTTVLTLTSTLLSSAERHVPRRRRNHHPGAALPAPAASPTRSESRQPKPPTS